MKDYSDVLGEAHRSILTPPGEEKHMATHEFYSTLFQGMLMARQRTTEVEA